MLMLMRITQVGSLPGVIYPNISSGDFSCTALSAQILENMSLWSQRRQFEELKKSGNQDFEATKDL